MDELTSKRPTATASERLDDRKAPRVRPKRPLWKELPVLILVALGLALLIRTFLVQVFYIPSGSMFNTLQIDDRIVVNKLAYRFGDIERGDVIVFNGGDSSWSPEVTPDPPSNAVQGFMQRVGEVFGFSAAGETDFVKRVIGLPGDRVKCCVNGKVTVNGKPLNEQSYLFPGDVPSATPIKEVIVPKGRLWVMGDHRSGSADSRAYMSNPDHGTIAADHVIGRAFAVIWPIKSWSGLDRPQTFDQFGKG